MRAQLAKIRLLVLDVDGTMTDGGVYILDDGRQFKRFDAKDGMGVKLAMNAGIAVGIISHSGSSGMVKERARMLGIEYCYVGQEPKAEVLERWCYDYSFNKSEIAYIGDDVNDLKIMQAVGFSACPSDAVDVIKEQADLVLSKKGGYGAIREFVDNYLLPAQTNV